MAAPENRKMRLCSADKLSIVKTFECGQCFRWNADERGVYTGVAMGRVLRVWEESGSVYCDAEDADAELWRLYFDLDADYASACALFTEPEYLRRCAEFGRGIRILRQEPWETLCSFIISQCNNIPRIKQIVETLCRLFGEALGGGYYAFPASESLAPLTEDDLAPLRAGYRAAYILAAARAVSSGSLDLEALRGLDAEAATAALMSINGVGKKVACCTTLYGLHVTDSFPIDVWMRRALKNHFPADFDPAALGSFSGLAQQYIFYYARSQGEK